MAVGEGAPFEVAVERGKIREFARATKSRDGAWSDGPEPVAPPTFLTTAAFWAGPGTSVWGDGDRDYSRVLHGEQEFVFHGEPVRAGMTLTAQQRIADTYTKQGRRGGEMQFTVIVTEFRDADGTLVAESRSTVIITGRAATEEQGDAS